MFIFPPPSTTLICEAMKALILTVASRDLKLPTESTEVVSEDVGF